MEKNSKAAASERRAGDSTRILLHSPDITLKGKNQEEFQNALTRNINRQLRTTNLNWQVSSARGRAYVNTTGRSQTEIDQALTILKDTAGVSSLAATRWLKPSEIKGEDELNWTLLEDTIVELAHEHYRPGATFSIKMNRVDKRLPCTSQEIQVRLGDVIRAETQWEKVKLKKPDCTFYIDAYPDGLYIYSDKIIGLGGLPVGTGGKVLSLLSGGIDSPVAAFMLSKRGCNVDFLHLSAGHIRVNEFQQSVVARLAAKLSRYTLRSRLFVAPYTYFDLQLQGRRTGYELVLFRRFMLRCAERLAGQLHSAALVAGDSLGQVASQTMENLVCASAPVGILVFRPLIGMNKQEIITLAQHIDTYNTSIEPYKDCCALIAQNPKTRSGDKEMTEMEQSLLPDYDEIISKTFADMQCFEYQCGKQVTSNKQ